MQDFVLTSESVTAGHPDKLCDQICDAVIDATLNQVAPTQVNAECAIANGVVFLSVAGGERAHLNLAEIARGTIADVGYHSGSFTADRCTVLTNTSSIALEEGWADPTTLKASRPITAFGFACNHTPSLMPYSVWCAHRLTRSLDAARRTGAPTYILPDGQAQVAVRFEKRRPVRIDSIVLTSAVSDAAPANADRLRRDLIDSVVSAAFADAAIAPDGDCHITVLRAAPSSEGGPANHAGLTGRKIADDNYGGYARQTATALSGKDPSRIDRIASYAARHLAKCVVAAELADECEVQVSYAIGESQPVSFEIDTLGSGKHDDGHLAKRLDELFDMRVGALIERFDLWNLARSRNGRFYRELAVYGHFGRDDLHAPWEDTSDMARI